jgi:hypothetical protein
MTETAATVFVVDDDGRPMRASLTRREREVLRGGWPGGSTNRLLRSWAPARPPSRSTAGSSASVAFWPCAGR